MAQRDWNPEWWSDEYEHRWDTTKDDLLRRYRDSALGQEALGRRARADNDTTRQASGGRPPHFPANQAGSSLLGGRHQQPVNIGAPLTGDGTFPAVPGKAPLTESGQTGGPKAKQGGWVVGLGEWTERDLAMRFGYELALRYGYGAAQHFQRAPWDEQLERRLRDDWAASRENVPWEEVKGHVKQGFDTARKQLR